jgi:hypothetical protein
MKYLIYLVLLLITLFLFGCYYAPFYSFDTDLPEPDSTSLDSYGENGFYFRGTPIFEDEIVKIGFGQTGYGRYIGSQLGIYQKSDVQTYIKDIDVKVLYHHNKILVSTNKSYSTNGQWENYEKLPDSLRYIKKYVNPLEKYQGSIEVQHFFIQDDIFTDAFLIKDKTFTYIIHIEYVNAGKLIAIDRQVKIYPYKKWGWYFPWLA